MAPPTTMEGVINLDLVYDLREMPERGEGFRRDALTGHVFFSERFKHQPTACVDELPLPGTMTAEEAIEQAALANGSPLDPEGAAVIANQLRSLPEDGYIGPGKTMQGLDPTPEDQMRVTAGLLVTALRSSIRIADRLAGLAGIQSPIRENAEGAARGLARLAERVEREVAST